MKFSVILLSLSAALLVDPQAADVTQGNFGAAKEEKNASARSKNASENPKAKGSEKPKAVTYPFYGTLDSIDEKQKIFILRGKKKNRVIAVTSDTRIQKNGSSAALQDGTPGERVSGSVRKNAAGQEEAVTLRFGPKE